VVHASRRGTSIHPCEGVIHSDIHPNNFLLDGHLDLQLCDFSGSTFGDLDGRALESARYFLPRDPLSKPMVRTDLFALGTVLYFFACGCEPYAGLGDDEVTERYARGEFPDVGECAWGDVMMRCWKGGYGCADEVWRELREVKLDG
jgi:serine/threonine protein kinase